MRKVTVTILALLLCAVWAVAQQGYPSSQTTTPSSSGQTTIKGCLSRSDGEFALTDTSGTSYKLTGDTAKLSDHVGHEVQIKGTTTDANATPGAASAAGAAARPTLDVTSMKHISETCSSKSKSETQKPPMSEKPPTAPR
jgi:Protein of unknown function (DUF5818)